MLDDCALTVLAVVVHRDLKRNKIVIDAGIPRGPPPLGNEPKEFRSLRALKILTATVALFVESAAYVHWAVNLGIIWA